MKDVNKIIKLASSYVGTKQGDLKHKEIIDKYNSYRPLPRDYMVKYTDAWCATFISSLAIQLNYTDLIPPECSCYYMIQLMKKLNIFIKDKKYVPKVGDIIFYDWDTNSTPDHVGIVERCDGNIIIVIEGNYSKGVNRRTIQVGQYNIYGFASPKYDNVSEWASYYWDKAIELGITDGSNPKDVATREQVITFLGRLGLLEKQE